MVSPAADIARRLADNAEAVCRRYLSQGRREGRYWLVGDPHNSPGRSLYVRLVRSPDGKGEAGKWTDAATGEHGDLLDIIAASLGPARFRDILDEARRFLALPPPVEPAPRSRQRTAEKSASGSPGAARRLFAASRPLAGTDADLYLRSRAITCLGGDLPLRFHPHCFYRPSIEDAPGTPGAWPAMIAAVTDLAGVTTAVHRTWLDPQTHRKAPVACPRRAMGNLLGNGVRFGAAGAVMAAGEGIETVLSVLEVTPKLPTIAALSSAHLAAIKFPKALRRLYVARDDDPAGAAALATLIDRAGSAGIELVPLAPVLADFNDDLRVLGPARLQANVASQLGFEDRHRFLKVHAV